MNELTDSLAALNAGEVASETVDFRKPLAIDLFCGLGGWTEALLAEGWRVIGFDIERHDYGTGAYPGQLVLQDVRTLHGAQFKDADLIVASPPCQFFSRMAMPFRCSWKQEEFERRRNLALELFRSCWRIQHEANEAAFHDGCLKCGIFHPATTLNGCEFTPKNVPLIVENVRGAEKYVGMGAAWKFGNFYLWGNLPALMPDSKAVKQPGRNFHFPEKYGIPSPSFHGAAHEPSVVAALGLKVPGINLTDVGFNCAAAQRMRAEGVKQRGGGAAWFDKALDERRKQATAIKNRKDRPDYPYSPGDSRKAASAQIAKIPFPLAQHIAKVFKPTPGPSPAKTGSQ